MSAALALAQAACHWCSAAVPAGRYLCDDCGVALDAETLPAPAPPRQPTPRQREVLRAYVAAGSMKLAAAELGVSRSTVKNVLSAAYQRTGTAGAVQLVWVMAGRPEL